MSGYWIIFIIPVGLIVGNFLDVCKYRPPSSIPLLCLSLYCPHCQKVLRWWQIIPLLNYLISKGKCRHCQQTISWGFPIIEFLSLTIAFLLFLRIETATAYIFYLFLFWGIMVGSVTDIVHRMIPNRLILMLFIGGSIFNLFFRVIDWTQAVVSLILSIALMLSIRWLVSWFLKNESLGMGDVKFSGVLGFYLGIENFLLALFIGSFLGIIYAYMIKNILKKSQYGYIPFIPFLGAGALIALFLLPELRSFLMM